MEFLHCGDRTQFSVAVIHIVDIFLLFWDLDLDQMTFIYELDRYFLDIHRMCKYELPTISLSKIIV